jgi:hypothetical protein
VLRRRSITSSSSRPGLPSPLVMTEERRATHRRPCGGFSRSLSLPIRCCHPLAPLASRPAMKITYPKITDLATTPAGPMPDFNMLPFDRTYKPRSVLEHPVESLRVRAQAHPRASRPPGPADAALGAVRGGQVRRPGLLSRPRRLPPGQAAAERQPRHPGGRPQAGPPLLPHLGRARRPGVRAGGRRPTSWAGGLTPCGPCARCPPR